MLNPKFFWLRLALIILLTLTIPKTAFASPLAERLQQFPHWDSKPTVQLAQGDLFYPDWMAGTWQVTSTLVDLAAPLAPDIVTPGFESNREHLEQPIQFQVKFAPQKPTVLGFPVAIFPKHQPIVAQRSFNGVKIAEAYLGKDAVISVKVDPENPNRQITFLRGKNQLISTVTGRSSENLNEHQFVATEITTQVFRSPSQIYLNEVETTTAYNLSSSGQVQADQVTAIYLSPQDPNYFTASGCPVALYRYRLELQPTQP